MEVNITGPLQVLEKEASYQTDGSENTSSRVGSGSSCRNCGGLGRLGRAGRLGVVGWGLGRRDRCACPGSSSLPGW